MLAGEESKCGCVIVELTQELIDGLWRDKVPQARQTSQAQKLRAETRVARDLRSMEFELKLAIKLHTKCSFSPVTQYLTNSYLANRQTLHSTGSN